VLALVLAPLGCTDTDYRKATRAAAGIATGLGAIQDANESLFKAQLLDKDEARAIAQGVADAVRVNDQFVGRLRTLKTIDASNKQLVGLWFSEVLTSLEALNEQGVLRVKNADAKAKLSVIFAGVQSSAAILTQLMAANGIRVYAVSSSRDLAGRARVRRGRRLRAQHGHARRRRLPALPEPRGDCRGASRRCSVNQGTAQAVIALIEISQHAISAALEIKKQNELQDEQLLAYAESKDAETLAKTQKFLDSLKG
jgi:hypothetical protein